MEIDVALKTDADTPEDPKHQLAKMILGTAAGFVTTKLVENLYDSVVDRIRSRKTSVITD